MPDIPVNNVVDKKEKNGKMEGGGEAQGVSDSKKAQP
jgi:hypothetical protein